ncbi:hypothetical protein QBC47DRAFT_389990 [Echria macrotheca]|uniref:Uncharacterized protein n=1 Tax=Echria macrotheca TaxID=438768 RepID=A0AAJ0B5R6_9PEZI|nr:hypothetical protein QBC47DRAFT_389990 [Echria macrotheca]
MHPQKYLIAMLAACTTISALPVSEVVDLSICARSDQTKSCLRKKSTEDYDDTTSYKRAVDTTDGICARTDQSQSCLRKKSEVGV